ncbi:hypothetical protein MM221_01355 [Salipaludibacillus sp. LMS25]|jgi:hypothetical protein|uniref:hypothetical protein n=1 Tax=Salipaludibacillus sp. LMS25 TaxID=2924031 RepID=UPI0020D1CD84|nr:hypothetical protein [Salipaludibacillus sp. LMS25]UTR15274.1 hypothetical protein MM221_01355 [Salipaludibacillus sp. LMS25]
MIRKLVVATLVIGVVAVLIVGINLDITAAVEHPLRWWYAGGITLLGVVCAFFFFALADIAEKLEESNGEMKPRKAEPTTLNRMVGDRDYNSHEDFTK